METAAIESVCFIQLSECLAVGCYQMADVVRVVKGRNSPPGPLLSAFFRSVGRRGFAGPKLVSNYFVSKSSWKKNGGKVYLP